ncbi:glycosyltransferase family 2 protein [Bacteroidales bacterium AH-315-N07]|nr:glycosyltransferase family 2 protein [Bacteroidales bacterium AH-315-N07]
MEEIGKNSISLILPIYNEEELVEESLRICLAALENDFDDYEIIVVDDGSKDNSLAIVKKVQQENPHVKIIENHINLNQGISIQRALTRCTKDYVLHNGIDLPLNPSELKGLIQIMEDNDVLILERKKYSGASLWRRFVSKINILLRKVLYPGLSKGVMDMNFVQIYRREILPMLLPLAKSPAFTTPEMLYRANYHNLKVIRKSMDFQARPGGRGSLGRLHDILWTLYDMIRFRYLLWLGLRVHGKAK